MGARLNYFYLGGERMKRRNNISLWQRKPRKQMTMADYADEMLQRLQSKETMETVRSGNALLSQLRPKTAAEWNAMTMVQPPKKPEWSDGIMFGKTRWPF